MSKSRTIYFRFAGYSGWEAVWCAFLPERVQAKRIARQLLGPEGPYKGWDVKEIPFVIQMPRCSYQVTECTGKKVTILEVGTDKV